MTQMDTSTFTAQQASVEKLIKEQNFTWKVIKGIAGCASHAFVGGVMWCALKDTTARTV